MFLHASSISILVSSTHTIKHTDSTRLQRFVKLGESARRIRLTITAPLPEEWRRLCREIGISLDSRVLRGGVAVDGHERGEEEADEALGGLYARWLG
jgi:hypothetical protein